MEEASLCAGYFLRGEQGAKLEHIKLIEAIALYSQTKDLKALSVAIAGTKAEAVLYALGNWTGGELKSRYGLEYADIMREVETLKGIIERFANE
jgi:hypothetical protein